MTVEVRHLRLPPQYLRVGGDPTRGRVCRHRRCSCRQYLRGDRGGGAAVAPGDPPCRPRAAAGAHRGDRLRRADRARDLRRHARGGAGAGQRREDQRRGLACATRTSHANWPRRRGEDRGQRHHGGVADRDASRGRLRRSLPRLRAGAERLRPPLHLLHHSVRPRQLALGADGRGGRARCAGCARTAIARWC